MTEILRWVTTVICWLALFTHIRTGIWLRFPIFSLWVLCASVYWPVWTASLNQYYIWEPTMFGLRVAAAVELFRLVSQRIPPIERRIIFAITAIVGILLIYIAVSENAFDGSSVLESFRSCRKLGNLTLASIVGSGALLYWIQPPKIDRELLSHALLVTALYILYAVTGFIPRSRWPLQPTVFFAGAGTILSTWIVRINLD